jgi:hypothetical protein
MPVATLKSDFNVNSFLTSVSITSWNKLHTRLKFLGPLCWLNNCTASLSKVSF